LIFTPVYRPIACDVTAALDGINIPGVWPPPWQHQNGVENVMENFLQTLSGDFIQKMSQSGLFLNIDLSCSNPNPISVKIDKAHGSVYVGKAKTEVGTVLALPTSFMPAYSNGSIRTKDRIPLDPSVALNILPELLSAETGLPIWFQLNGTTTISLPFLLGIRGSPFIRISCGMSFASVPHMIAKPDGPLIGPMSCADTMNHVSVKPLDAPDDHFIDKFLALAEAVKNVISITMMLLGFTCGSILLCCSGPCWSSWSQLCLRRQARDQVADASDSKSVGGKTDDVSGWTVYPLPMGDDDGVQEV
jgi:hypothetical protein